MRCRGWPQPVVNITWLVIVAGFGVTLGCGGSQPARVSGASVDADAAAAAAMGEFDKNGDGALDKDELKACPPLAAAAAAYDADGNGAVSVAEITQRLTELFGSSASMTNATCAVTFSGRPLPGAKVVLRPAAMLGDGVKPAEGTTDETGVAYPTLADADRPAGVRGEVVYPGLYHVEITHPQRQLSARYNSASELGCEVDPGARNGTNFRFDLK